MYTAGPSASGRPNPDTTRCPHSGSGVHRNLLLVWHRHWEARAVRKLSWEHTVMAHGERPLLGPLLLSCTRDSVAECARSFGLQVSSKRKNELVYDLVQACRDPRTHGQVCRRILSRWSVQEICAFLTSRGVHHTKLGRTKDALIGGLVTVAGPAHSASPDPGTSSSSPVRPAVAALPVESPDSRGLELQLVPWSASAKPLRRRLRKVWKRLAGKVRKVDKRKALSHHIMQALRVALASDERSVREIREEVERVVGCSLLAGHAHIFFHRQLTRMQAKRRPCARGVRGGRGVQLAHPFVPRQT